MNSIDWIILKLLRLDTKKINTFMKNKNVHTIDSYKKVNKKWIEKCYQVKEKLKNMELNEKRVKNLKGYLKKWKKMEKDFETVKKEWDKGQILFNSFSDFIVDELFRVK